jgi:hypothetical protein
MENFDMTQKRNGKRERGGESKPQTVSPEKLRQTASRIQYEVLPSIYSLLDAPVPFSQGDLKDFPRPSPEDQAALAGVEVIREVGEKLALGLNTLAAGLERKQEPSAEVLHMLEPLISAIHRP